MHLELRTSVSQSYQQVVENFNDDLFKVLNPPFPPVKLLRYDGSHTNDEVHLELNFFLFRQKWISLITEDASDERETYFIDAGKQLPFFLRYWRHKHRIINAGKTTVIVDDVTFHTPFFLFDWLMYPVFYLQFLYRKPIYRRYFG